MPPRREPEALVIGEALVDVVHDGAGRVTERPGGSPANVAVGLARLGRPTALLTDLGEDAYGDRLVAHLESEGVHLLAGRRPGRRTSSATARIGSDGSASYVFDLSWDPPAPVSAGAPRVVHTGSLGAVLEPGAATVLALLDRLRPTATVSYDLNVRLAAMGTREEVRRRVEAVTARADVVKASDEDLESLFPGQDLVSSARFLLDLGPAAVIVTCGGEGARCLTGSDETSVPAVRATVADTIGAGDSFCGGVIDRLWELDLLGAGARERLRGLDAATWQDVLAHAAAVAAVTVSRPGADPPTRAELAHR
ncbi:MAG: carbohydrate kinase [Nocardioides sp.]|uniref:carbohydrate kinase family protein n=1 Tax=Nocardioides sp. TaxID=35761 RepID=UPI0039E24C31